MMKISAPEEVALRVWPCLSDNFAYALTQANRAVVVDPGEAGVVLSGLAAVGARAVGVLNTHGHDDHIAGNAGVVSAFSCPLLGPAGAGIPGLDREVRDGEELDFGFCRLRVLATPGHTRHCLSFFEPDRRILICADTLFVGGCGRPLECPPGVLWQSLRTLADLPGDTRVCCGHEYTVDNLRFALAILPGDPDLAAALAAAQARRAAGQPTVPSTLDQEKRANLFLRAGEPAVARAVGLPGAPAVEVFALLRQWKSEGRTR